MAPPLIAGAVSQISGAVTDAGQFQQRVMLLLCVKPVLLLVCVVWVRVGLGGLEPVLVLGAKGQVGLTPFSRHSLCCLLV